MIQKILNVYVDFSKIVSMELVGESDYFIKLRIQLLQGPLTIYIDNYQTEEQDLKVKKAFEEALETWKNLNVVSDYDFPG